MKVKITVSNDEFLRKNDYRQYLHIQAPKTKLFFLDGEPEDANTSRDFSDVFKIVDIVKEAYEAGKNGEELVIEYEEIDDFE